MPIPYVQAGLWGLVGGSSPAGRRSSRLLCISAPAPFAAVMAAGSGVLISAVAFDLMDGAYARGGFDSTSAGFLAGAAVYTAANIYIS